MTTLVPVLFPVLLDAATDPLVRAVAAYLARYRGQTRVHTESDLRAYLVWCRERGVEPLKANRAQIELYVRWMQEVRRFQPERWDEFRTGSKHDFTLLVGPRTRPPRPDSGLNTPDPSATFSDCNATRYILSHPEQHDPAWDKPCDSPARPSTSR